jgi:hypothetical protein
MTIKWNYRVFVEITAIISFGEVFYQEDGAIAGCTEMLWNLGEKCLEELGKT